MMRILHMTTSVDVTVLLTCYCGPIEGWQLPRELLRLVLEFASLLRVGRHTMLFEIYLPTKVKCPTKKVIKLRRKVVAASGGWRR